MFNKVPVDHNACLLLCVVQCHATRPVANHLSPAAAALPLPPQGVDELVQMIFSKAEPKKFGSTLMNGPVLAGLVQAYVKVGGERMEGQGSSVLGLG